MFSEGNLRFEQVLARRTLSKNALGRLFLALGNIILLAILAEKHVIWTKNWKKVTLIDKKQPPQITASMISVRKK